MQDGIDQIIIGYRKLIKERYDYDRLSVRYELPETFEPENLETFKEYFLEYIYPSPEKRIELESAFQDLNGYTKHPEKLLRLLMDSGALLFKYGRYLPKILKAGLKALKSFQAARNMEDLLLEVAQKNQYDIPYSAETMRSLLTVLDKKDIENYIVHNEALFNTLHDRKLVKKVMDIISHIVSKMQKKNNVYSESEIRGMELGLEIIENGNTLFDQLSTNDQKLLIEMVSLIERDALENIYDPNKSQ